MIVFICLNLRIPFSSLESDIFCLFLLLLLFLYLNCVPGPYLFEMSIRSDGSREENER